MQEKTIFKGYRVDKASIAFNALKKDETFKISPHFDCKLTGNNENYNLTITVIINQSVTGDKTPFDLEVTLSGMFGLGTDLSNDKKGQLRFALETLFPYLRAFVTNLTTSCAMPPFILPFIDIEQMVSSMRRQDEYLN